MTIPVVLADFESDLVQRTATRIIGDAATTKEKFSRLHDYVRDDIKFGFPATGDLTKASDTIRLRLGQCNTKSTLLLALCKAVGIPAQVHFSLISKEIQRGFFTGLAYHLMPREISHSWLEVQIDDEWKRTDGYINDTLLQASSQRTLKQRGWTTGFSVALGAAGQDYGSCATFGTFQQMAAVTDDHGVYDEPSDYFKSECYKNRPGPIRLILYRLKVAAVNRRVQAIRAKADVRKHRRTADTNKSASLDTQ